MIIISVLCFRCSLVIQVKMQVGYTSLEFWIEVWAGDVHLAFFNIEIMLWD